MQESYVVLVVLPAPTPWQSSSEAIYGPYSTSAEADLLIASAVAAHAVRIAVFPLNRGHSGALDVAL